MRCFIAIDVPHNISIQLRELQKQFENLASITLPNVFHLTMKFLGDISEKQLEEIKINLKKVKFKPFELELTTIGSFPNDQRINVLWVGVNPAEKVIELQREVEKNLDGFAKDLRFYPHITIGRVKFVKNKERLRALLTTKVDGMFRAESFKLIKSELLSDGPNYTVLEIFS